MNIQLTRIVRLIVNSRPSSSWQWTGEGGIKYYGFTYYPRYPGEKDPHWEKTKLFMVQRVKPYHGNPYWEKHILNEFGLNHRKGDIAIVKNIPEVNSKLWTIKHLIKITPITFPDGPPTPEDIGATYLKEDGTLVIYKKFEVDEKRIEAANNLQKQVSRMDTATKRKQLRLRWLNPYFGTM